MSKPPHFIIVQQKLASGDREVLLFQCNYMFWGFFCLSIPLCSIWVSINVSGWSVLHAWVLGRSTCFPWISHPERFNLANAAFHGVTGWFELEGTLETIQFHPLPWAGTPSSCPSRSSCDSVILSLCGKGLFSSFPCHSFPQSPKHYQTLDFGKGKLTFAIFEQE